MPFTEVIARKRDGNALTREAIDSFVQGVTDGSIPDYQSAALLMAVMIRGMTAAETAWLTDAMLRSGERVDLSSLPGIKVGKHSTGGVGDKVSIALAPLAAACGVLVPKMSGRGLGHTGGTLDKLEAIPGYRTSLTTAEFIAVLRAIGVSIIGQTSTLVPADRRIYALRDVTATVESVPLIASSVMSKKLAEGSTALVLDVKCGRGAFMKNEDDARRLAQAMVSIGAHAGVPTHALLSRMDDPLGCTIGNALEIGECIELLRGRGHADLVSLVITLGTRMVTLGTGQSPEAAEQSIRDALTSGGGLERMRAMIAQHGGDPSVVDQPERLPQARHATMVRAARSGYVARLDAEVLGRAASRLGAGREQVGDVVDHAAGIILERRTGEAVRAGDVVLRLLYNDARRCEDGVAVAESAIGIEDVPPVVPPIVIGWEA